MIETIVVGAVILISLAIWLFVYRSTTEVNQTQTVDQEYYFAYSLLLSRVKMDLRSATEWHKVDEKTYSMKVLANPQDGIPVEKKVFYRLTGDGEKIERNDGKSSVVYDFSNFKGGNKFVFRISP